jgi:hypothetical protein
VHACQGSSWLTVFSDSFFKQKHVSSQTSFLLNYLAVAFLM